MLQEILSLFDRAVSDDKLFWRLREGIEKTQSSKFIGQYLRLLAADMGKDDSETAETLVLSVNEVIALKKETLIMLRAVVET